MARVLSDQAQRVLSMQPVALQRTTLYQALAAAIGDQMDKLDDALSEMERNVVPASADEWLDLWLRQVGAPILTGATDPQKQAALAASVQRMVSDGSGLSWQQIANALLGTGWTYATHRQDLSVSATNPAVHHITIWVGGTIDATLAQALFDQITPANTVVDVTYLTDDLLLDVGLLDVGALR